MKRFVLYLIYFSIILSIVLGSAEAIVRHYPNSYRYKHEWITKHGADVSTLIIGGSHTYFGIDAAALGDSVFNLANVAQHPEYDYRILEKYRSRLPNLRTLIFAVDAVNIFDPPIEELDWDRERATYYRLYMDIDKHPIVSRFGLELLNIEAFKRKFPSALRYLIKGGASLDCDSLGRFCGYDNKTPLDSAEFRALALTAVERHRCTDWSNVDYNLAWLEKVADFSAKRHLRVIIVTPPVSSDYYENVNAKQLGEMYRVINYITAKYHFIEYYDFIADKRFSRVDFVDGDHLSRSGAERFTKILAPLLKK